MQYSDDYFLSVLPELNPPLEDVPRAVMTELESLAADDRIDFGLAINRQCSVLWTYAVFEQLRLGNFEYDISTSKIPDASGLLWRDINTVAFGLFDPEFEGEGFGLAILSNSPPHADPQDKHRGLIHFRRLNRSFPVIVRHMETELHGLHVPSLGSSACWVRSNHNPAHWGFLTSGHVVAGIGAGQGVPLASGTNGTMQNSKHPPLMPLLFQHRGRAERSSKSLPR